MPIFDITVDKERVERTTAPEEAKTKPEESEGTLQSYMLEQLGEWAELIRSDVKAQDYKIGWFGKSMRVVYGGDIYRWILEHVESNEKKARQICQKMLEKEIIQNVDGRIDFHTVDLYRLYMDREDIADNMFRRWKDQVRGALEVSINLVGLIE